YFRAYSDSAVFLRSLEHPDPAHPVLSKPSGRRRSRGPTEFCAHHSLDRISTLLSLGKPIEPESGSITRRAHENGRRRSRCRQSRPRRTSDRNARPDGTLDLGSRIHSSRPLSDSGRTSLYGFLRLDWSSTL